MLKFFGTGSAFSHEINSSAYIHKGKNLFIIDCGENTFNTISSYINKNHIENVDIAITHTHSDHCGGLSTLIYWCWYIKKIRINILTPVKIYDNIQTLLNILGHENEQYELINLKSSYMTNVRINITPVETEHCDNMDCYGYIMLSDDKHEYYSGDSRTLPQIIKDTADLYDKFYQDVSMAHYDGNVHMSLQVLKKEYPSYVWSKIEPYHTMDIENIFSIKQELYHTK